MVAGKDCSATLCPVSLVRSMLGGSLTSRILMLMWHSMALLTLPLMVALITAEYDVVHASRFNKPIIVSVGVGNERTP